VEPRYNYRRAGVEPRYNYRRAGAEPRYKLPPRGGGTPLY